MTTLVTRPLASRPAGAGDAIESGEDAPTAAIPEQLSDGLALAQHSVAFAQRHAGVALTPAGRDRLVEVVVGLVAQLEEWAADPVGGPPDPWTYLRRRWHRQTRLGWWGDVPAATRRMLTGLEPFGRDSLVQVAWTASAGPSPAVLSRWRTGLLDLDPASDLGAAQRLARRRASRSASGAGRGHRGQAELWHDPRRKVRFSRRAGSSPDLQVPHRASAGRVEFPTLGPEPRGSR